MLAFRHGFTIRLKRFKPRAPNFQGPQNFGSKKNFQLFWKEFICIFILVQCTFFNHAADKSLWKNERDAKD